MCNVGRITDNDFKESNAIAIAKRIIEKNKNIKTFFSEMDKRPNIDGQMSLIKNGYELTTIDVQIKTLPKNYKNKVKNTYTYDCDTKAFNVVNKRITQNPVVLILVDINEEVVYTILLTHEYVSNLRIGNQTMKRIKFDDNNIFCEEKFIKETLNYVKLLKMDVEMYVDSGLINDILNNKNKPVYSSSSEISDNEDYQLVFRRGEITGYLNAFFVDLNEKSAFHMILLKIISDYDIDEYNHEMIQIVENKEVLTVNRSIQRTSATDSDICNVLYEVAIHLDRSLLYQSAGVPTFYIENYGDIWSLHAQRLDKEW